MFWVCLPKVRTSNPPRREQQSRKISALVCRILQPTYPKWRTEHYAETIHCGVSDPVWKYHPEFWVTIINDSTGRKDPYREETTKTWTNYAQKRWQIFWPTDHSPSPYSSLICPQIIEALFSQQKCWRCLARPFAPPRVSTLAVTNAYRAPTAVHSPSNAP